MRTALALIFASVVSACGGSDSRSDGGNVPFTTVTRASWLDVESHEGVVARNETEFDAIWVRHSGGRPSPAPPVVDFNVNQVVGYFLGSRSNGCYSMSITHITQYHDRLVVSYKEQVPVAGAVCPAAVVSPVHFVAVPQSPLRVEFVAE